MDGYKNAVRKMLDTPIQIGNNRDMDSSFSGGVSCIQFFEEALDEATAHYKSKCKDLLPTSLTQPEPCPDDWIFYDGQCYLVSLSKEVFSKAEVKCLPNVNSDYNSRLTWTENPKVWHHLSVLVKAKTGSTSYFAGISDQDDDGFFENSYGSNVSLSSSALFIQDQSLSGECGVVKMENNGYLSTASCLSNLPYVCTTEPSSVKTDYGCPKGFYPYRGKCFLPREESITYDAAMVSRSVETSTNTFKIHFSRKHVQTMALSLCPSRMKTSMTSLCNGLDDQVKYSID